MTVSEKGINVTEIPQKEEKSIADNYAIFRCMWNIYQN